MRRDHIQPGLEHSVFRTSWRQWMERSELGRPWLQALTGLPSLKQHQQPTGPRGGQPLSRNALVSCSGRGPCLHSTPQNLLLGALCLVVPCLSRRTGLGACDWMDQLGPRRGRGVSSKQQGAYTTHTARRTPCSPVSFL